MILKTGTLVLVADGRRLNLLRNEGTATDPRLATIVKEEAANSPAHEQGTDRPGRTQSRMGERRSSYAETDRHDEGEAVFLRHAAEVLEKAVGTEADADIVVIAEPRALGRLRDHYGRCTRNKLRLEIAKDLAGQTSAAIIAAILAQEPA